MSIDHLTVHIRRDADHPEELLWHVGRSWVEGHEWRSAVIARGRTVTSNQEQPVRDALTDCLYSIQWELRQLRLPLS